jgi:hypothetical protein
VEFFKKITTDLAWVYKVGGGVGACDHDGNRYWEHGLWSGSMMGNGLREWEHDGNMNCWLGAKWEQGL